MQNRFECRSEVGEKGMNIKKMNERKLKWWTFDLGKKRSNMHLQLINTELCIIIFYQIP